MVKRKDAARPAAGTKSASSAPPPPTGSKSLMPANTPPRPSKMRILTLLVRIGSLAFALYVIWNRIDPNKNPSDLDLAKNRETYSPIVVDEGKRNAVLDAVKVSLAWRIVSAARTGHSFSTPPRQHAYKAYERDAFGFDECVLRPPTQPAVPDTRSSPTTATTPSPTAAATCPPQAPSATS